jgi:hypothetical protein
MVACWRLLYSLRPAATASTWGAAWIQRSHARDPFSCVGGRYYVLLQWIRCHPWFGEHHAGPRRSTKWTSIYIIFIRGRGPTCGCRQESAEYGQPLHRVVKS